jgi:hypothetical protein
LAVPRSPFLAAQVRHPHGHFRPGASSSRVNRSCLTEHGTNHDGRARFNGPGDPIPVAIASASYLAEGARPGRAGALTDRAYRTWPGSRR